MARSISIYRRRPQLVDLYLRQRPGIAAYQFKAANNFDVAVPVLFQTVPAQGFRSATVPDDTGFTDRQFRDTTRFRFNLQIILPQFQQLLMLSRCSLKLPQLLPPG